MNVSPLTLSSRLTDFRLGRSNGRRAALIVLCLILAGDVELNPGPGDQLTAPSLLTFATFNIRSIRSAGKVAVLHDVIAERSIDLMALTETWVKPDDPPAVANDPAPPGYKIIHVPRPCVRRVTRSSSNLGGGLAVIHRDTLSVRPHPLLKEVQLPTLFEVQVVRVGSSPPFISVVNAYRPPSSDIGQFIDELGNLIAAIVVGSNDRLMLCGDLNCGNPDGGLDARLLDVLTEFGLTQYVAEPTRDDRLLDVIAADDGVRVTDVRVGESFGISDHQLVTAVLPRPAVVQCPVRVISHRKYNRLDPAVFEARLRTSSLFSAPATEINEFADQMKREVVAALDEICPLRTRRRRLPRHRRSPLSPETVASKRRRRYLERRWRRTRDPNDRTLFKHCCRETNDLICDSRKRDISRRLKQCATARQKWTVVRQLLHSSNSSANNVANSTINSDSFATYFNCKIANLKSNIAAQLSRHTPGFFTDPLCSQSCLSAASTVTAAEVSKLLHSLPDKSSVLDYVPTSIIKTCSSVFSEAIAQLANLSFSQGTFPAPFKHASVTPLLKKPNLDPGLPANYRPISTLNNVSKILEKLFLARLLQHINTSSNLNPHQSAYRRFHSTETSLIHLLDSIYNSADNGLATLLLSLDLSAAFDTVDHSILLSRLHTSFGISGSVLAWLSSYLSNRTFSVNLNSFSSVPLTVTCGVPQGSILGPILFSLYMSPIANIVSSFGVSQQQYADDTQLFVFLSPANLDNQLTRLQSCLSSVRDWFLRNGLVLNPDKTEAICFGTASRRRSLSHLSSINVIDISVDLSDHIKLLGVTFDTALNFDKHISNVCASSYFHIKALRRIRPYIDLPVAKSIASSIVGSRLDYANGALFGIPVRNIHRLQRVQNCLARVVTDDWSTSSNTILSDLHWLPVQRRIDYKLTTLVCRSAPQYLNALLTPYTPSRHLRSSDQHRLAAPRCNTCIGSRGFRNSGPSLWNSIPVELRSTASYKSFCSHLKTHLFRN